MNNIILVPLLFKKSYIEIAYLYLLGVNYKYCLRTFNRKNMFLRCDFDVF